MSKINISDLSVQYDYLRELPLDPISLKYTNPNARDLKIDKIEFLKKIKNQENNNQGVLEEEKTFKTGCFSLVAPEPMGFPKLLHYSESCLKLIGLSEKAPLNPTSDFIKYVSGNKIISNTHPWAHCYVGHQFGAFAGRLGDGRALSLAQIKNNNQDIWELQLKGSGETPYSRMGDGFAVLRSSLREYLCSEANEALGIPTTRALSLVVTSQLVHREKIEPGAIVCRVAPTWLRFGSFQLFQMTGETEALKILVDYTIRHHFPHLIKDINLEKDDIPFQVYREFYFEICRKTGYLVAMWQAFGFCHGVLNTDNMSILGLTLDYGPFGFLSEFNPSWTPNLSDHESRYSYENQPLVGAWNLNKLGEALQPLFGKNVPPILLTLYSDYIEDNTERSPIIQEGIELYYNEFKSTYTNKMREKLGLLTWSENDMKDLLAPLLVYLEADKIDFTIFFRNLSHLSTKFDLKLLNQESNNNPLIYDILSFLQIQGDTSQINQNNQVKIKEIDIEEWKEWIVKYVIRLETDHVNLKDISISKQMLNSNPRFILRNWIAQEVIDDLYKEPRNTEKLDIIYAITCKFPYLEDSEIDFDSHPYLNSKILEYYSGTGPTNMIDLKCSCSS